MNVADAFNRLTEGQPLYQRELAKSIEILANSGLLGTAALMVQASMSNQIDISSPDSQIAMQVRESLIQVQTLISLEDQLSQIKPKDEDNA